MNIIQRLIPTKFATRPGTKIKPTYITIHETDNEGLKANAEAHARLQENGNSRSASWHYQVDDQYIIQSIPDNEEGWHAGDYDGNMRSIAIEICVNKDGDFKKAVEKAAELTKYLMDKHGIPINRVVQHNHWSGKNCPSHLRAGNKGVKWSDFLLLLQEKEYQVTIPNLAFWQARALVKEFEGKDFKCKGVSVKVYKPGQHPEKNDPYRFVLFADKEKAQAVTDELKERGYSRTEMKEA